MANIDDLTKEVSDELAKYGLNINQLNLRIEKIRRWIEKYCSNLEVVVDDPYLEIVNQAIHKAVYSSRDFICEEIEKQGLKYEVMEEVWTKALSEYDMSGLHEDRYVDLQIDKHIKGESDKNHYLNEYIDDEEINSRYTETAKKSYSLADQLYTTYIFRMLEKKKPSNKKSDIRGHSFSLKEKQKSTVIILKLFNINKKVSGVASAEIDIESKERSIPEFALLKEEIDSL